MVPIERAWRDLSMPRLTIGKTENTGKYSGYAKFFQPGHDAQTAKTQSQITQMDFKEDEISHAHCC